MGSLRKKIRSNRKKINALSVSFKLWFYKSVVQLGTLDFAQDIFELSKAFQTTKWKSKMEFSIKRRTPPPLMDIFSIHFFSFAIESYFYETDFTPGLSQKYHF